MPKYAPPRDDGLKPYVVELAEWGRRRSKLVYAATVSEARFKAIGRMRYVVAVGCRRATPDDLLAVLPPKDTP